MSSNPYEIQQTQAVDSSSVPLTGTTGHAGVHFPTGSRPSKPGSSSKKKSAAPSKAKPAAAKPAPAQQPKPGSREYLAQEAEKMAAAGIGNPQAIVDRFNDGAIEERNAGKEPSAYVITDEFTQQCYAGNDPFETAVRPFADANPDLVFHWAHPDVCEKMGGTGGFQEVRDPKTGKRVEQSGHFLTFQPKSVNQEIHVKPQQIRSEMALGKMRSDTDDDLRREAGGDLGMEGKGIALGRHDGSMRERRY